MGSAILIFAGPEDDLALREYAGSIGLTLLHRYAHDLTAEENAKAFEDPSRGGWFSFLPVSSLGRHPHPAIGLCDVIDSLLHYIRPHYIHPYLVAGQVILNDDVRALADQTRPYFRKLRRWVQKNWRRREEDRYYIGPDAERILEIEGVRTAYLPPNTKFRTIIID